MLKPWFILILIGLAACLPRPASDVQKAQAELSIKGQVLHSSASLSGRTAIYVERAPEAETVTADDGRFSLVFDAARLEQLRLQYGLQNKFLHLYFVSETGNAESAVIDSIELQALGELDLGKIQLQAEVPISGRVISGVSGEPLEEARIWLGRRQLSTAADGSFSGTLPSALASPILIEKKGFVQTKGTWLPGNNPREFALFSDLTPVGAIELPPIPRTEGPNRPISLSYSANSSAYWIRFANDPDALRQDYQPEAPWLELSKPLQLTPSAVIFYQFADRDRKLFGPILSYNPQPAAE